MTLKHSRMSKWAKQQLTRVHKESSVSTTTLICPSTVVRDVPTLTCPSTVVRDVPEYSNTGYFKSSIQHTNLCTLQTQEALSELHSKGQSLKTKAPQDSSR